MKPTSDQLNDFFGHRPIPGVFFEHNVSVLVVSEVHEGAAGAIISIEELGDDPTFLVELGTGQDVVIRQSLLRAAEA